MPENNDLDVSALDQSEPCSHICKCGRAWSHQELEISPCPTPQLSITATCPYCAESTFRKVKPNGEVRGYKEILDGVKEHYSKGHLEARRIIELQLDEESTFKNMIVNGATDEQLEQHYFDILEKMESFRVRALQFRKMKTEKDIEDLSKVSDEDRAAFEEAKRKNTSPERIKNRTDARQSKRSKAIASLAKMIQSTTGISEAEAMERATKLVPA